MKLIDINCSIVFENVEYDYSTIFKGCSKWISTFESKGLTNKRILIYADISEIVLYLIIASLSTNNTYIPVDTKLPIERVNSILEQAEPTVVVTEKKYASKFSCNMIFADDFEIFPDHGIFTNEFGSGNAYIIFTSGTTGYPKGVIIDKSSLKSFYIGTQVALDLTECKSILCVTTMSFDIFALESIYALNQGKKVFLATEQQKSSPRLLLSLIKNQKIDCIQLTPSRLKLLQCLDSKMNYFQDVHVIIVGGENLPYDVLNKVQHETKARVYNAYGPSEATIWVSYSELVDADVNIGNPMKGTRFYLINEDGDLIEDESIGELYIGGENLAQGYLNNQEETNAKFVNLKVCGERVYKTGDLCNKRNGKYYWCGRSDNQVKFRGYRIELEEIEKVFNQYEGVNGAVVYLYKNNEAGKEYIVAFIEKNEKYHEKDCDHFLKEYLPDYMVPQVIKGVGKFSYLINGKVNRKSLIESYKGE